MKIPAIVALLSGIAPWAVAEEPVKEAPALSIETLNKRGVTGQLGIPLGKLVWIDATIVAGDELKTKAARGSYLLKVTAVEGKPLDPPQILNFECPPYSRAEHLANSPFSFLLVRAPEWEKS